MTLRHYIITRAVYDPTQWTDEENAARFDLFTNVTATALAHLEVSEIPLKWILALHKHDPYLNERVTLARNAAKVAGMAFDFIVVDHEAESRAQTAYKAYKTQWDVLIRPDGPKLTTRLDDDDAITPDYTTRLYDALGHADPTQRVAYIFPVGIRVFGGRYTVVHHRTNAMSTLATPAGDFGTVYDIPHRRVIEYVDNIIHPDGDVAWLWMRHPDVLSGHQFAEVPLKGADKIQDLFPIRWDAIGTEPTAPKRTGGDNLW